MAHGAFDYLVISFALKGEVELFRGCFNFWVCFWAVFYIGGGSVQSTEALSVLREGRGAEGQPSRILSNVTEI